MGYHKNSFNKVVLTGNIGHGPELKKTAKDVSYLRFGLATTYAFKDTEETTWHNCVAWGNSAEILAQHLAKGRKLQIEGRLRTTSFENGEGQAVKRTEVLVESFVFLSGRVAAKAEDSSKASKKKK
ncbi:single-stranded DNA-binding protein [candidate division KSB1 bacterium]|nr:single-stranded DNA-binding protein [candidate division KSB1 bacterium]